jgi:hypothetical protein
MSSISVEDSDTSSLASSVFLRTRTQGWLRQVRIEHFTSPFVLSLYSGGGSIVSDLSCTHRRMFTIGLGNEGTEP